MNITLTTDQYKYLSEEADFLTPDLKEKFPKANQEQQSYNINLNDETAQKLHDLCLEKLVNSGFNQDDSPNQIGSILEKILDRLA